MSRAARASLVAAFFVLVCLGLVLQPDVRETTRTSFGRVPEGFGALYDWLVALDLPVARSYAAASSLPSAQTVWWIEPRTPCEAPDECDEIAAWTQGGGTAVILLRGGAGETGRCNPVAGVELPVGSGVVTPAGDGSHALVDGPLVGAPRALACGELASFAPAEGWETFASLDAHPFVLERALGDGRLVLVADAGFLQNDCFGKGDAAPLAADLVRRYGAPWLDERAHGLRASRGTLSTLARSPVLPFFAGVALLGLLYVWCGSTVPPRRLEEPVILAPTLDSFVDSLAALYAATTDHTRVLERYRELTASRLRRQFGLAPGTAAARLPEQLARRGLSPAGLEALTSQRRITTRDELEREAAVLDALGREAQP